MSKAKHKPKQGRTNTTWTEDEINALVAMHRAGYDRWVIAKDLDRSPGAVQQRIYSMGLHKQPQKYVEDQTRKFTPVSDTLTNQDTTMDVSSCTTTSPVKAFWNWLTGKKG